MRGIRSQRGFTLLELTLATAMIAMLALTLYASMNIGFRARRSVQQQTIAARDAAIALDLIERELQSLMPPSDGLVSAFVGYAMGAGGAEADSVEFYALGADDLADTSPLADGLRRVKLALSSSTTGPLLVKYTDRNLLAPVQREPTQDVLATHVLAFSVRYYDGYGWLSEWDSTQQDDTLPVAVQVSIAVSNPTSPDNTQPYRFTRIIPLSTGVIADSTTTSEDEQ